MGLFSKFTNSAAKVQNKNVLEAIIAASLLVAAADEEIEESETKTLTELLAHNDLLKAFSQVEISKIVNNYTGLLKAGFRVGKVKMLREIAEIASNPQHAEEVFVTALTIAEADGEIEEKELVVLKDIGRTLGISLSNYGLG